MDVTKIMSQPVVVLGEGSTLADVARAMLRHRIACVPIVDASGLMVGIVTEADFAAKDAWLPFSTFRAPRLFGEWLGRDVEGVYAAVREKAVRDIMTRRVVAVTEEARVDEVLERMLHDGVRRLPVVRDGRPVGIVTRHDLLKLLAPENEAAAAS